MKQGQPSFVRTSLVLAITRCIAGLMLAGCAQKPTSDAIASSSEGRTSVSRSGESAAANGAAMVRFVNAVPGSPAMAIARDSSVLFRNAAFGAVSPYMELSGGAVRLHLRSAGLPDAVAALDASLGDGRRYTIVAHADSGGVLRLGLVRDDLVPDEGKARLRVVNAVPGTNDLGIAIDGREELVLSDVDYAGDASVADLEPTTAGFTVRRKDERATVLAVKSMGLVAGTAYTFIIAASPRGELVAIAFSDLTELR